MALGKNISLQMLKKLANVQTIIMNHMLNLKCISPSTVKRVPTDIVSFNLNT